MAKKVDKSGELHQLILKGDGLALSKLYDLYGAEVIRKLKGWYRKLAKTDTALFVEAVNEAFLGYYRNPFTFDPNKNTLLRFLEIAAERDLKNILVREKKHLETQKVPDNVELEEKFWNSISKNAKMPDGQLIFNESMALINKELANHFDNDLDLKLAKLVIAGERETDVFSGVLEIEELEIAEQRSEVKKNKDRIKKVLERNGVEEKLKKLLQ
jgi:hypothetical protein